MNDLSENIALQQAMAVTPPEPPSMAAQDEPAATSGFWTELRVHLAIALLIAGWAGSVALFGLPGLFLPALAAVPVIFIIIVGLTWG